MAQVEVHSLASGSSGNAVLIKADGHGLLIDAGLSPRTLTTALGRRGIAPGSLDGILITHEHDDHIRGAADVSSRLNAPIVANRATLSAAHYRGAFRDSIELPAGDQTAVGSFLVRSFSISHDAVDPVGYVVETGGVRLFYATDLGCAPESVYQEMRGAALCILEANHDIEWLRRGPYPAFMKVRVGSDRGHLSNEAASNLIMRKLDEDGPACFWLAHLSAVNNSPAFAHRYVDERVRAGAKVAYKLEVALRGRPSVSWRSGTMAIQKTLF